MYYLFYWHIYYFRDLAHNSYLMLDIGLFLQLHSSSVVLDKCLKCKNDLIIVSSEMRWEKESNTRALKLKLEKNPKQVGCQDLEWPLFADVFSHLWNTSEREMECLAHRQECVKGGGSGVNYLNTITASNNHHPSLASSHSTPATIPSAHLGWLSRQIGQTLCHPKEAPPCTNWKPERHS